jgi:3'-phosphoadenosine 5'-phosphosulfate sulfotransferase (PAPS reductase)/FAD synthetase
MRTESGSNAPRPGVPGRIVTDINLFNHKIDPAKFPFPIMHVDTGHNFPEVLDFRDRRVAELGERLVVASVQESIDKGRVREEPGPDQSRNPLHTETLHDDNLEHQFDALFGGGRRADGRRVPPRGGAVARRA